MYCCLLCNNLGSRLHTIFSYVIYIFFPIKIKSSKIQKKEVKDSHSCRPFLEGKDISILKLVLRHEIIVVWNSCLVKDSFVVYIFKKQSLKTTWGFCKEVLYLCHELFSVFWVIAEMMKFTGIKRMSGFCLILGGRGICHWDLLGTLTAKSK